METAVPRHAALVRNDKDGLEVRHFPTAAQAASVSQARDLSFPPRIEVLQVAGNRNGKIRHTDFARRLGVRPNLVRQVYKRGGLPGAIEHSAYILMVPQRLLRLAETYGLRRVEQMAKAGELT